MILTPAIRKFALSNVSITEGRLLDFETADEITRALVSAALRAARTSAGGKA
jgi:hypothetical protein